MGIAVEHLRKDHMQIYASMDMMKHILREPLKISFTHPGFA